MSEIPKTFIKYVFGEIVDIDQSIEEESKSNIVKRPIKAFGWEWKRTFFNRSRMSISDLYNTHSHTATRTIDENFMDYAYRIARNSYCLQGNMGCLMVRNVRKGEGDRKYEKMPDEVEIIVRVVNAALLKPLFSDCHAEANAVSVCAATGAKWVKAWRVTSAAPCTECFKLITMARIGRVYVQNRTQVRQSKNVLND